MRSGAHVRGAGTFGLQSGSRRGVRSASEEHGMLRLPPPSQSVLPPLQGFCPECGWLGKLCVCGLKRNLHHNLRCQRVSASKGL